MTRRCELSALPKPSMWLEIKDGLNTISYHYFRLCKQVVKDVRRWAKTPTCGRRSIAGLSSHQQNFLIELQTRNFS